MEYIILNIGTSIYIVHYEINPAGSYIFRIYGTTPIYFTIYSLFNMLVSLGPALHISWFHFIRPFPDLTQAHSRMKSVENRQRHRDVCDDSPSPQAIEMKLNRMRFRSRLFQSVYSPHRQICHEKESYYFPPRFLS